MNCDVVICEVKSRSGGVVCGAVERCGGIVRQCVGGVMLRQAVVG